jgi:hypothetical protein
MAKASTTSGVRIVRVPLTPVLAAAGLTTILALAAHLASGGSMPAVPVLLAITALTTLAATVLSRVNAPAWTLILAAGAAQQVLHLAFEALGSAPAAAEPPAGPSQGHHAEIDPAQLATTASAAAGHGGPHSEYMMLMLHLHLAAAVLTAVLIGWSRRTFGKGNAPGTARGGLPQKPAPRRRYLGSGFSGPAATAKLPQRP